MINTKQLSVIILVLLLHIQIYPAQMKMIIQNSGPGMYSNIILSNDGSLIGVTYTASPDIYIWNMQGKLQHTIKTNTTVGPAIFSISDDNRYVAYYNNNYEIHIKDCITNAVTVINTSGNYINKLCYSLKFLKDKKLLAGFVTSKNQMVEETLTKNKYDTILSKISYDEYKTTFQKSYSFDAEKKIYTIIEENLDFNNLIAAYSVAGEPLKSSMEVSNTLELLDIDAGTKKILHKTQSNYTNYISYIVPNENKNEMLVYYFDGTLKQLTMNGDLINEIKADPNMYYNNNIKYSNDGKYFGWSSTNGIKVSTRNGLLAINKPDQITTSDIDINNRRTIELIYDQDANKNLKHSLMLKDFDRNIIKKLCEPEKDGYILRFTPDGTRTVYGMSNGIVSIIHNETGDIVNLLSDNNGEWISYTSDGYFDGSKNCGKLVAMSSGLDVFGIDQFAAHKNRPDIILQRIGFADQDTIDYFHYLYTKRIGRMNIDTSLSGTIPPESEILQIEKKDKFATITFKLSGNTSKIVQYNIFINDIPLYGIMGKNISTETVTLSEKVELTSGKNKIEVTCINEQGLESYRAVGYVQYDVPVKGNLYYIGFGVSKYRDSSLNLKYADKDITDLEKTFKNIPKNFKSIITHTFTNENCTVSAIDKAKTILEQTKTDDTVVLFIAGHGVHDTDEGSTYYYLTHEAEINNLQKSAAAFEKIESLLQGMPARNKLFLMDTCESGEIDDATVSLSSTISGTTRSISQRSLSKTKNPGKSKKIREFLFEKDRYIYNDLLRRSGAIVFSSCKGGEYSYENDEFENGYFTEKIITAFSDTKTDTNKDGIISTEELRLYVTQEVNAISSGLQNPVIDRDNIYQIFGF